jgi:hypothetical protein
VPKQQLNRPRLQALGFGIGGVGLMTDEKKSPAALVLLAWILVGLPLSWGVYNTVRNSMKLFQKPSPPAGMVKSG